MGYSYNFQDLEFDFSDNKYLSHYDFMLSEFFKATQEVKTKFRNAYKEEYGVGPYKHMMTNYWYKWENGSRIVSDTQSDRICELMSNLLDNSAKHRLGMNEFLMTIKATVKNFLEAQKRSHSKIQTYYNTKDITQAFHTELNKIQTIKLVNLKPIILTEEDKGVALEISKYILETKLQKTFDQIERDFNVFIPYIIKFNRTIISAKYLIRLFNISIDIKNIGYEDIKIPKFSIKELSINSRFKKYSDKYLAYELISIHNDDNERISNAFLNENDLSMFFTHYENLRKTNNELSINSTFIGEGGILNLKAMFKPFKLFLRSILISLIKLILYFTVITTFVLLTIHDKLNSLLIFGGLFIILLVLNLIIEEIKQFISLTKNFKIYG